MIKPFQTDASVAREQDDALFKDLLDQCADESKDPDPGVLGESLNVIDPQDLRIDKILESALATLQEVKDAKQMADKCCDRFVKTPACETTPKCESGWLRARVEWRYNDSRYGDDEYKTLALKGGGSFVKWPQIGPDGKTEHKLLQRCRFYPALITENMRMVFVRTTKKQLTYMRDIKWLGFAKLAGKAAFYTGVYFPKENTKTRNIIIALGRAPGGEDCCLEFLFDGEQFLLVNILSKAPFYDRGFDALLKEELINRPEVLDDFLHRCLLPFSCNRLAIDKKPLKKYLTDGKYMVGLTEVAQTPFLIIQKAVGVL